MTCGEASDMRISNLAVWDRNEDGDAVQKPSSKRVTVHLVHTGPPHIPYASIDVSISMDYPDEPTRDYVANLLNEGKPRGDLYSLSWEPGEERATLSSVDTGLNIASLRLEPVSA